MPKRKFAWLFFLIAVTGLAAQTTATEISVRGRVVDDSGTPIGSTQLELRSWSGAVLGLGYTNSNGTFDFDTGAVGPYQLVIAQSDQTVVVPVDPSHLDNVEVRLSRPVTKPPDNSLTVSVNDLEASDKARSKLDAATKALMKSESEKAMELTNQAIALSPHWGKAYFMRGILEMDQDHYDAAKADLLNAQEYDPQSQPTLVALGKLYTAEKDYPSAEANLRQALASPAPSWQAEFEMANLMLEEENFAEAENYARSALNNSPPAPTEAYFLLAQAEYYQGKNQAAANDYQQFLAVPAERETPSYEKAVAAARMRLATMPH